ncbi:type IV secretion system DNA-binding domain-containing protein [Pseudoflavonifractor phocaeensis]|uniref:type IV secretion system DNA-binding domain-containing protein n=1 Tax=Pseudoflavonifractor phocaeensis TaxID=1870988 RepID=UPI00195A6DAF|nr:type IV secretion system DNA-binding domain-containing protein [Pseudoflavonifractor phocaeensis]MBM6939376.1 type IV secretion system DNA-binding domain-containing protein [Pseudoflavonifractor phocaeensis]
MNYLRRCLLGSNLEENLPPQCADPLIALPGTCLDRSVTLGLNRSALSRGLLAMGATGTGKSAFLRACGKQLRERLGTAYSMVVLEVKEDYSPHLFRPGDLILGQGPDRGRSVRWNLFADLTDDGWEDETIRLNCMEFTRQLFADKKNQSQQFFPDAAQLLLYVVLVRYIQEARGSLLQRRKLSNAGLRAFFSQYDPEQYVSLMERCEDPGVVRMLLGTSADNPQALGVLGEEVLTVLSTFSDVFGEEGDFSIRRFVREKSGRALFLRFDPAYRETQRRVFSLLINLMFKELLARRSGPAGNLVFLCDELPTIGKVDLPSALNLGRAKGLLCLAGLQSVEQLYALYGEHEGNTALAGFCNQVLFAPNDPRTRRYIRDLFGENRVEELILSPGGVHTIQRGGYVVEDSHLTRLCVGDCICSLCDSRSMADGGAGSRAPFFFHMAMPHDLNGGSPT